MEQPSRREEYSQATRSALVAAAREAFTAHGYANASIEEIARDARVTRGALYHHFPSKLALFEEVVHAAQSEMAARVSSAAVKETDPWKRMEVGIGEFLSASHASDYRQIVLEDAISVLGWLRWREIDDQYMLGGTTAAFTALAQAGEIPADSVNMLTHLLVGAITEAALVVASSATPHQAADEARTLLIQLLKGAGH
ncbi:MAG: helix-turn-helix domain-containing protein [Tepidiformaceae bacterium]